MATKAAKLVTIVYMTALGFPAARLAVEAKRAENGTVSARRPKARTWEAYPVGSKILEGDHTARVKSAVWIDSGRGGEITRYHSFAAEWSKVMAEVCA